MTAHSGDAQSPVAALTRFLISCPLQSSADCTAVGKRLKSRLSLKPCLGSPEGQPWGPGVPSHLSILHPHGRVGLGQILFPSVPQASLLHKTPSCGAEEGFCPWGVGTWVQPPPKKQMEGPEEGSSPPGTWAAQGYMLSGLTPIFSPLSKATSLEQSPEEYQVFHSALGHHHQPCSAGQL